MDEGEWVRAEGRCELKQGWMRADGLIVVVLVLVYSYNIVQRYQLLIHLIHAYGGIQCVRENVFTVMFYYVAETVLKKLLNKIKEQRSEAESERTQTTEATQENLGNLCVCVCV